MKGYEIIAYTIWSYRGNPVHSSNIMKGYKNRLTHLIKFDKDTEIKDDAIALRMTNSMHGSNNLNFALQKEPCLGLK